MRILLQIITRNIRQKQMQLTLLVMVFIIGFSSGWLIFLLTGDMSKYCKIVYVSKSEIHKYEKERVEKAQSNLRQTANNKNSQMFFGHINQAVRLIQSFGDAYKDNNTKVIFTNDEFVVGEGVYSVSLPIYKAVIKQLEKEREKTEINVIERVIVGDEIEPNEVK